MPLTRLEKTGFVYVAYRRNLVDDFLQFQKTMDDEAKDRASPRDIVLDLTKDDSLTEGELGIIAKVVKRFGGTKRKLRIIANHPIMQKIKLSNLHTVDSVLTYDSHAALLAAINRA